MPRTKNAQVQTRTPEDAIQDAYTTLAEVYKPESSREDLASAVGQAMEELEDFVEFEEDEEDE